MPFDGRLLARTRWPVAAAQRALVGGGFELIAAGPGSLACCAQPNYVPRRCRAITVAAKEHLTKANIMRSRKLETALYENMALRCLVRTTCAALCFAFVLIAFAPLTLPAFAEEAASAKPAAATVKKVAFLGVRLQNDNEGLDPTSEAETARQHKLQALFKTLLEEKGGFKVIEPSPEVMKRIEAGQNIGDCNGCEVKFGKEIGGDQIAWITVQKISNLILNMNVYMADVATEKMTYIKSVDIRGNTDDSWMRSLTYLMKNYFDVK
jgi:Protein of unknown function (DUF2380)